MWHVPGVREGCGRVKIIAGIYSSDVDTEGALSPDLHPHSS